MFTRSTTLLAALLVLAVHAGASESPTPPKVPAALPVMEDVKTAPAPRVVESPADVPRHVNATVRDERASSAAEPSVRAAIPYPLHDVDEAGTLWVRGRTYKASFGEDGATYIPFLGSRAPRNYPLSFRVASITCGDAQVGFVASARPTRAGALVSFDRGSVVEQYEVDAEGMEQRFVFDALPERGEVVVTLEVTSELAGRADESGFAFENERGGVRYGRAFALDATGRKIGIESRLEAGRIRLVVPASFVEEAVFPLVVDPYSGTITVDNDADDDRNPDIAFCTTAVSALAVYESVFSSTDHDVFARRYVDQVLTHVAAVDLSTADWRNPKVASNELAGQYLCVAEVIPVTTATRIIRGREIDAATTVMDAQFTISGAESGDKHAPDVGGDPVLVGPTYYCVVWQRDVSATDTDIHGRLVRSDSTLVGGSTILIANSLSTLDRVPSISKTDGLAPFSTQTWDLVWEHEFSSTDSDVQGARIRWDGVIVSPTFSVAATALDERSPTASEPLNDSAAGRPFLALYSLGVDLRLRAFDGSSLLATYDFAAAAGQSLGTPAVTTDGRLWLYAYTTRTGTFPFYDTDLAAGTAALVNGVFSFPESLVLASSGSVNEVQPQMASTLGWGNPYRSYVAYETNTLLGTGDVFYAVYDSPINAGYTSYCAGTNALCPCGNGGTGGAGCANSVNPSGGLLGINGYALMGSDTCELLAFGLPATTSVLFFQGSNALGGSPFGDGLRCAGGTVIRLGTKTASGGTAAYGYPSDVPIHIRGALPPTGGWRYYQAWYRNSAPFCTAATFNLTNGVGLLWVP